MSNKEENLKRLIIKEKLKFDFKDLYKITDKWGFIRQAYMEMLPLILERSEQSIKNGIDPYFFDWTKEFSPIEEIAWNSIRSNGGLILYPQFPLFNYFIDFANPYLRIGLELDGKDYHNEEKDKFRDEKLADFGWRIFRVQGKECYTKFLAGYELDELQYEGNDQNVNREKELENWFLNSCDGVIYAIKELFFTDPEYRNPEYYYFARQSLEKHKLADFKIPT